MYKLFVKLKKKKQKTLYIGNLYSKRDWGHAKDYVNAMWLMMQKKRAEDFVIATGQQTSVKNFINLVSKSLGIKLFWRGKGINEKAFNSEGEVIVASDKVYYRPLEVNNLLGDAKKARKKLNWKPKYKLNDLIKDMIHEELKKFK